MTVHYRLREGARAEGWAPDESRALTPAEAQPLLAAGLIVPCLTGRPVQDVHRGPPLR